MKSLLGREMPYTSNIGKGVFDISMGQLFKNFLPEMVRAFTDEAKTLANRSIKA